MSAAIERALEERSSELQLPVAKPSTTEQPQSKDPPPSKATLQETRKQQRRQRRLGRYEQVVQLHREGHSQKAISQALEIQRKTVRRWLRAGQFPERKRPDHSDNNRHENWSGRSRFSHFKLIRLPWAFHPHSGSGVALGDEFRAAAFDEVAGFGDDVFQYVCQLPDARLAVDGFRC